MNSATLSLIVTAALLLGATRADAQPMPRYYLPPSVGVGPVINPAPLYAPPSLFPSTYSPPSVYPPPAFGGFIFSNRGAYPYFTYGGTYGQPYTTRYYFGGTWYYR